MPTLIDATVGGASSNSYALASEGDTYFAARLYSTDWTGATTTLKEQALIMATQRIDQDEFVGYRVSSTQALKWPRYAAPIPDGGGYIHAYYAADEIPVLVKHAQFELALVLLGSNILAPTGVENIDALTVGPISIDFRQPVSSGALPDQVARLLRGLRTNSSGAAIVRA